MSASRENWVDCLVPVDPVLYLRRGDPADPRIADIIDAAPDAPARVRPGDAVLIGFPQDEGVRRNFGRVGAAAGPAEIRRCLGRLVAPRAYDPVQSPALLTRSLRDLGDVRCDPDLEASQQRLGDVIAAVRAAGAFPIILGGGHETAYGHFLGYTATDPSRARKEAVASDTDSTRDPSDQSRARKEAVAEGVDSSNRFLTGAALTPGAARIENSVPLAIINLDAHFDVRPLRDHRGHSGSPFRQALDHADRLVPDAGYLCLGIQEHAAPAAAIEFMKSRGCVWSSLADLQSYFTTPLTNRPPEPPALSRFLAAHHKRAGTNLMLSVDLDVVRQSDAPGVSATSPIGLTSEQLLALVNMVLAHGVTSMDIVELNPQFDRDGQTARLAALMVLNALGLKSS